MTVSAETTWGGSHSEGCLADPYSAGLGVPF
jgi:hypothetical protein